MHYSTSIFDRKRSAQLAFLNEPYMTKLEPDLDQTQINLTHFKRVFFSQACIGRKYAIDSV